MPGIDDASHISLLAQVVPYTYYAYRPNNGYVTFDRSYT